MGTGKVSCQLLVPRSFILNDMCHKENTEHTCYLFVLAITQAGHHE